MAEQIVIVGAGRAGAYAAATLRQEGFTGRIVLVGEEPLPPYDRPPLSKDVLVGKAAGADGLIFPRAFYQENQIELHLADPALRLDVAQRRLQLQSGLSVPFDRLLLATGARARTLPWDAESVGRIHYLRTAADADRIAQRLPQSRRVAIVGGGVIGFEVAASAVSVGCEVTILEAAPQVMARMMPSEMAVYLVGYHKDRGVRVLTAARPSAVDGHGTTPRAVLLEDGRSVEADLVVVGVGITPEVELARAAGLTVENGIVTDACCQTSEAGIYAAGDAARFFHPLYGRLLRLEAWRHAERHGQVAALNLLGRAVEYRDVPWLFSDQYDLHLQVAGLLDDADAFVTRGAWKEDGAELIFALKGDRLRGAAGLGKTDAIGRDIRLAQRLIEAEVPVDAARLGDAGVTLKSLLKARGASTTGSAPGRSGLEAATEPQPPRV
jgi:3-phenylpropionate/trans-cinnamate dioxygenase ferredoxin reductase component